jgi:LPXTG-motif cell wall-anchored protein
MTGAATFKFPHPFAPGESCFPQEPGLIDGLAFDSDDGTLWLSDDAATKIYHVTPTGIILGSFDTPIHPVTEQQGCNSGIEVVPGGCLQLSLYQVSSPHYPHVIVKVAKNSPSGPILDWFVHAVGAGSDGAEDLEFDANTFAPCCVLWSNTPSGPNLLTAWQVECEGNCAPAIPTLTEWGLIIFGVVLLGFISWVFVRRRKAVVSLQ